MCACAWGNIGQGNFVVIDLAARMVKMLVEEVRMYNKELSCFAKQGF